jgi:hypothetical protein
MNQGASQVLGASGTDSSGNATWSSVNKYCPPGQGSSCTAPIGHWPLDEHTGTSTVYDISENNNDGTLSEFSEDEWVHGKHGSALDFSDQEGENINFSNPSVFNDLSALTWEAWFYYNGDTVNNQTIFNKNGNKKLKINSGSGYLEGLVQYDSEHASCNGGFKPSTNQWHHLAMTWSTSDDTIRVYIDGVETCNDGASGTPIDDSTGDFYAGSSSEGYGAPGYLDDIRFYNYVRTPAQIAWDYNRGGPIGWWKFDECSATTANDSGSGGNDGTINANSGNNVGICGGSAGDMWADGETGKINASLAFDGDDDVVNFSSPTKLDDLPGGDFSISAWVYSTDTTDYQDIIILQKQSGATDGWYLGIKNSNTNPQTWKLETEVQFDTQDAYKATLINSSYGEVNTWVHVVSIFDSSDNSIRMFLNGKEAQYEGGATNGSGTYQTDVSNSLIAAEDASNGQEFTGQIDEIKVWNYALNDKQIQAEYSNGAVSFQ